MGMTMPAGWKMNQLDPKQPTSTHKEFKESNLTEFGRSIHQSRAAVTGDSSGYNFSSVRMDHLVTRGATKVERNRFAVRVTDRIFLMWAKWAIATRNYIPLEILASLPQISSWTWAWQYDGWPSVNPVDDASADETNLKNGLVTHRELLAQRGVDWKEHFDSLAEQRTYAREKGIEDLLYPWLAKSQPGMAPTPAQPSQRTNEGTRGKPQLHHGAEWQAEEDTVIEEELAHAA